MVGEGENGGIVTLWDENRQNKAENKKKGDGAAKGQINTQTQATKKKNK